MDGYCKKNVKGPQIKEAAEVSKGNKTLALVSIRLKVHSKKKQFHEGDIIHEGIRFFVIIVIFCRNSHEFKSFSFW